MITDQVAIDTYLTPPDAATALVRIIAELDGATTSIDGVCFSLTHRAIVAGLIRAVQRGVAVGGTGLILDYTQSRGHEAASAVQALHLAGIVPTIGTAVTGQYAHLKVLVLDGKTVLSGSLNYSMDGFLEDNNLDAIVSPTRAAAFLAFIQVNKAWCLVHEGRYQLAAG